MHLCNPEAWHILGCKSYNHQQWCGELVPIANSAVVLSHISLAPHTGIHAVQPSACATVTHSLHQDLILQRRSSFQEDQEDENSCIPSGIKLLESPKTLGDLIRSKRECPTVKVAENFVRSHLGGICIFEVEGLGFSSCCPQVCKLPDNFVHCCSVVPPNTHLQLSVD